MKTVTVQLEDDSHEFLKSFSLEKTGKENLSSAIRILIKEKRTDIQNKK
jgi:predicted CopG family antitoxin